MEHIPLASVASRRFEDTAVTKKILQDMADALHLPEAFQLSTNAEFAMGWWFFTISVSKEAMRLMADNSMFEGDSKAVADQLLSCIQTRLDKAGCDARVRMHSEPSMFARYWMWLMK